MATQRRDERLDKRLAINMRSLHEPIMMREPVKLGSYSLKKEGPTDREFFDDDSELKILDLPQDLDNISFDLKEGYVPLRDGGPLYGATTEAGLSELLMWVLKHRNRFALANQQKTKSSNLNTDFITFRGILTKIMATPYENREDWLICATKYNGTTYLYSFRTENKLADEQSKDDQSNIMSYGGFRFEEYISRHSQEQPIRAQSKDGRHNEHCCVVRTRIKNHSLVYGAEMDCVEPSADIERLKMSDFIEIKTTKSVHTQRQYENLCKFKMLKWWAQSHLIGISKLICGYRDDDLVVRQIEKFNVHELPKKGNDYWSHIVCQNFLEQFLSFVSSCVTDDPNVVYKFTWRPRSDVICHKSVSGEFEVLPKWYVQALGTTPK